MRVWAAWERWACSLIGLVDPGITPSKKTLDELLADRPGDRRDSSGAHLRLPLLDAPDSAPDNDRGITFPMFLTMMGEHLYDFDAEPELLEAFESFDEGDKGVVRCDEIRKWLGDVGERMDDGEVRTRLTPGSVNWRMTEHDL